MSHKPAAPLRTDCDAARLPSCLPVSVPRREEPSSASSLPNVAVRRGEQDLAGLNGGGRLDEPLSPTQPARAGLVLISLIAVAAVANLNLSVANVALPSIGRAFDSSQTTLDLIAVGYSLGFAPSVLYLGMNISTALGGLRPVNDQAGVSPTS